MTAARLLQGEVFGRLTALSLVSEAKRRSWRCKCTCGRQAIVAQAELTKGDTRSCGCLKAELLIVKNRQNKVDHSKLTANEERAHRKWKQMWARVRHPVGKNECYEGVTVCTAWGEFHAFLRDMGVPPIGYSLERKDNTLGYSTKNCKWIPLCRQAANTSRNHFETYKGVRKTVSDHAVENGLRPQLVFDRIGKLNWSIERALDTPVRKHNWRNYEH